MKTSGHKTAVKTRLLMILFCSVLVGCQEQDVAAVVDAQKKSLESQKKVDAQIAAMKSQLDDLQKAVTVLRLDLNSTKSRYESALLDISSKGYERVDTTSGFFLVSLKEVKAYANGFKLTLQIGNPSSATYSGFSINAKWGKSFDKVNDYAAWEKSQHENKVTFTEKLLPSSWNTVDLVLAPAQKEDLEYIEVSLETNDVYLNVH
jgi:hypothetical protein